MGLSSAITSVPVSETLSDRLGVERIEGARIDHFDADIAVELVRNRHRFAEQTLGRDDRHVLAGTLDRCLTDGN